MDKLERLLYILNLLDKGERVRPQELAKALGVSERTIYRYMQTLNQAGFPIYFDLKCGSYVFQEGFSLRKGLLSPEEVFILQAGKGYLLKTLGKGVEGIYEKLLRKCQFSEAKVSNEAFPVIQEVSNDQDLLPLLRELKLAIKEHEIVEIEYKKSLSAKPERRDIEPRVLFYSLGFWYVYARERENFSPRTFVLDKIVALRRTGKYFLPTRDPEFEPSKIEEAFGPYPDAERKKVVIRVSPEVRDYFLRKKWIKHQEVKELETGELEVTFHVRGLVVFKHWLYSWIPYVKILYPPDLIKEAKKDLEKALEELNKILT